jgi:predicted amidohydrolase
MPSLKLALVQIDPVEVPISFSPDPAIRSAEYARLNFPKIKKYLKDLEDKDVDLVVFPETIPGGFSTEAQLSSDIQFFQKWCKKNKKYVMINEALVLKRGREVYNTCVFVNPDEQVERYSKRNFYVTESEIYKPGKEARIFNVKDVKIYPLICNDILSSGFTEEAKQMGADLIVYQSAAVAHALTPKTRRKHPEDKLTPEAIEYFKKNPRFKKGFIWQDRLVSDSVENNIPIVFCNICGEHWNDPLPLGGGHSMVILPGKGVVKQLGEEEGILFYNLKLESNIT